MFVRCGKKEGGVKGKMRKTNEEVRFYIERINEILRKEGKDYYYNYTSRYGYKAIDICYYANSGCSDFMTGLTTGEAYNIAYSMYLTLEEEKRDENKLPD